MTIPDQLTHTHELHSNRQEDWDRFLAVHSGSFYQLYGWKNIYESEFGHTCHYLSVTKGNAVIGLLPLVQIKSHLFGHILCSVPFLNFGGLCATSEIAKNILLARAQQITRREGAEFLELRSTEVLDESLPTSTHKVSMTLELESDSEVIWGKFSSKHRNNIRRVYKNGITVRSGGAEYLDTFYSLISHSWHMLGTPIYRKSFFQKVLETFPDKTRIFIAYREEKPIACAFNGMFNQIVEGLWAGGLAEYRNTQANYVLYWEMIKDSCEKGFKYYHLGRSTTDSGGEQFKKKWNAVQTQLYWQYYLNKTDQIPQINVDNPKYKLTIATWKKLPLFIVNTVGPYLSRSIP